MLTFCVDVLVGGEDSLFLLMWWFLLWVFCLLLVLVWGLLLGVFGSCCVCSCVVAGCVGVLILGCGL